MSVLETISFSARATGPGLNLTVRFDGQEIYAQELATDIAKIKYEFDDADNTDHCLEIEMQGKTRNHTRLDQSGNIIEDRCIEISDVEVGGIALGYMMTEVSIYEHDTNGTTERFQDKFFGSMGCNGVVRLEFTSPVYLWLLEHL